MRTTLAWVLLVGVALPTQVSVIALPFKDLHILGPHLVLVVLNLLQTYKRGSPQPHFYLLVVSCISCQQMDLALVSWSCNGGQIRGLNLWFLAPLCWTSQWRFAKIYSSLFWCSRMLMKWDFDGKWWQTKWWRTLFAYQNSWWNKGRLVNHPKAASFRVMGKALRIMTLLVKYKITCVT